MNEEIKIVTHEGKRYYTRPDGTPIINQGFNLALPFINGYAIVAIADKKSGRLQYGILKENSSYLLEPQFDFAESCDNETEYMKGIARVRIGDKEYGIGLQKNISPEATTADVLRIMNNVGVEISQEDVKKTLEKINSEEKANSELKSPDLKHPIEIKNPITDNLITDYRLPITDYRSPITDNQTTNPTMKQPNLSKSLICEIISILKGEACAYALFEKYYNKRDFSLQETDTKIDPRKLGIWFEYLCTGAIPINGVMPQPQHLKNKDELKAPYKIMKAHVENWKALSAEYCFDVEKRVDKKGKEHPTINLYYHIDYPVDYPEIGGASLRTDWLGRVLYKDTSEMEVAHIDIKSSGKTDNKWDSDGWERGNLWKKSKLMIQPLHTKWMWREMFKRDVAYYFALFDSSNENNFRFIRVEIPKNNIDQYPELLMEFRVLLQKWESEGFPPTKLPKICGECPIAATCKHCVKVPQVETVFFDIIKSDFNK